MRKLEKVEIEIGKKVNILGSDTKYYILTIVSDDNYSDEDNELALSDALHCQENGELFEVQDEKVNFMEIDSFKGATFNINGKTKSYSLMGMFKMKDVIEKHLKTCSHLYRDLKYYKDFETKVDKYLSQQEEGQSLAQEHLDQDEDFEYSVGENFAKFLETSNGRMYDNNQASEILKNEYFEKFGDNALQFDAEMSHCYVYTKDKEEAKQFLLFVYEKYIKSYLEPWYGGFDEFVEEFDNLPELERSLFDKMSW